MDDRSEIAQLPVDRPRVTERGVAKRVKVDAGTASVVMYSSPLEPSAQNRSLRYGLSIPRYRGRCQYAQGRFAPEPPRTSTTALDSIDIGADRRRAVTRGSAATATAHP